METIRARTYKEVRTVRVRGPPVEPTLPLSINTETATTQSNVSQALSGPRKRSSATRATRSPAQPNHLGSTPLLNTTTEVAAISAAIPTKAKRYIHPASAKERKPS